MLRKEVGPWPTFLVLAAAVFIVFLAKPHLRLVPIMIVGSTVLFFLTRASRLQKAKAESTHPQGDTPNQAG